jgi:fibronectin-binding autotransporter adhesin
MNIPTLPARSILAVRIVPIALAVLGFATKAAAQTATGDFSAAFLGAGNFDTQVGLSATKSYLYNVNLGNTPNVTVNGVTFTGAAGATPSVAGQWAVTATTVFASGGPNPGGAMGALTTDFIYGTGTTAEVVTLNALTAGETYVVSFYNSSWEAASTGRRQTMSASGASVSGSGLFTFDEDMGATAQGQWNVLRYTFNATTTQQLINFVAQVTGTTMHLYDFSVEQVYNNTFASGTDWTTATWGAPGTPNAKGTNANFAAAGAPSAINLNTNVTVGHLQFAGTNAWTVTNTAGSALTLQAEVGGVSTISAKAGSHIVNPNITLSNGLLKVGAGGVALNGNITGGTNFVHVSAGTLSLNGVNNYRGETVINGVLEVNTLSDYGVASSIGSRALADENATVTGVGLHFEGGTLRFLGSTPQSTNRNIRILNGATAATLDASGTVPAATMSFTHTGASLNLFDTGGTRTLTLTGSNTGDNGFAIPLINQAASATSLTKTGAGTWVLNGVDVNSATGTTLISNGVLKLAKTGVNSVQGPLTIGNGSALAVAQLGGTGGNQILDTIVPTFAGTGATAGILRMNNLNETVAGLSSAAGAGIVENESGAAGTSTLTLNVPGAQTFTGIFRNGDGVGTDGVLALAKIGVGTQTLTGTHTHTGPTSVTAGTLLNNGLFSNSAVTVSSGGIVGGTGTFSAGLIGNVNGRISPGTATTVGTLTANALTLNAGSFVDLEFGATNDLVNITSAGGLGLNGGAVNVFATGGVTPLTANATYTLLDYTTSYTGPLTNLSIGNAQVGKLYTIVDDTTNTLLTLTIGDASVTEWNGTALDGQWGTGGNWTAGEANGVGAVARLGTIPVAPTSVNLASPKTVGSVIFNNASAYTLGGSALTLDNGAATAILSVAAGSHTINNAVTLNTNANVDAAASTSLLLAGNVTGPRALFKSGLGTAILSGTNNYTLTAVNAGTLQIGNGGATGTLGSGDVTIAPAGTLAFNRSDDLTISNNLVGGGVVTKLGTNTLTLTGANAIGTLNITGGTLKPGNATTLGTTTAVVVNGATLDLNGFGVTLGSLAGTNGIVTDNSGLPVTNTLIVNQATNTTFDGVITIGPDGDIALNKQGAGVLTLAGSSSNNFYGGVTVSDGTLRLQKTTGNAVVSDITVGNGVGSDVLELGGPDQIADNSVVTFNAGPSGNSAFFRINGFAETVKGLNSTTALAAVLENNGATGTAILTVDTAGGNFTYDGIIRNTSSAASVFGITKAGAGTQTLRNTAAVAVDSYTGATTVTGGTLVLDNLTGFGASPVTVTNGQLVVENLAGFGAPTAALNSATPGALTINTNTRDLSIGTVLTGTGQLVKGGAGVLTLNGGSPGFTGTTILNAGTLALGADNVLGGSTIIINGGGLRAANAGRTLGNAVTINGSFTLGRLTNLVGTITLGADVTISANNFDGPANNSSDLGAIGGNFRLSLAEGPQGIGTGSLNLTGINTNSGGTALLSGRATVTATGSLANAPLTVNGGEFNVNNPTQAITSLSGSGGSLVLAATNTLTVTQTGNATFSGAVSGAGALVKSGADALTLAGIGTGHTGTTTVNAGLLSITGSLNGSALNVNGGTLGGSGTVTSPVTLAAGAFLAPGVGLGQLTVNGNLDLSAAIAGTDSGALQFELGATTDKVTIGTGALTLGLAGSTPLDFSDFHFSAVAGLLPGDYTLFDSGAAITGGLGLNVTGDFDGFTGTLTLADSDHDIVLHVVPEPGSALLILGGVALLANRRRRKA